MNLEFKAIFFDQKIDLEIKFIHFKYYFNLTTIKVFLNNLM